MTEMRWIATNALCLVGGWLYGPIQARRRRRLASGADVRRIVVLNGVGGVGNLVLLSGLLLNLRHLFPSARIALAMPRSSLAGEILGDDLVDEMLFFDAGSDGRKGLLLFAWRVLRPRGFDLGLGTFFTPTVLTSGALALAGCRYRIAYAQSRRRGFLNTITLVDCGGSEIDRHLRLLAFADQNLERRVAVRVPAPGARAADEYLARNSLGVDRPLLGVHPGSDRASALKRWPVERFRSVIRRVVGNGLADVLVFVGPDDEDLLVPLAEGLPARAAIVRERNFGVVAALIGRCRAFLSNDSGLMHVAAALNVPVAAIFGPTGTEKNAPIGETVIFTAAGVTCRPCYVAPPITCVHDRRYCLEHIEVGEVASALRKMLAAAREEDASPAVGGAAVAADVRRTSVR